MTKRLVIPLLLKIKYIKFANQNSNRFRHQPKTTKKTKTPTVIFPLSHQLTLPEFSAIALTPAISLEEVLDIDTELFLIKCPKKVKSHSDPQSHSKFSFHHSFPTQFTNLIPYPIHIRSSTFSLTLNL